MNTLGFAGTILFLLAMMGFVLLARRMKAILLPALILIGSGFALLVLHLILRSYSGTSFLFEHVPGGATPVFGNLLTYLGMFIGAVLLLAGFYRVNRVAMSMGDRENLEQEQRLIGKALAESETRYRQFFEEDLSGNFISTPEGKVLLCNPSFARMFGYDSASEVMQKEAVLLFESSRAYENFVELVRQHRHLAGYEMNMRRKDDSRLYVIANLNGEFDDQGQLVQIHGFVLDETERVKVEQALRNSMEQFRQLFEDGPVGMMLVQLNGEIIKVNTAFCRMVGYPEAELRKISLDKITHPEDIGKDVERVDLLAKGEIASYRTEKRFVTKIGDVIWGLMTASVVKEADGTPLYGVRIVEDITARKRGEEELERSLSVLRATFESTTDGLLVVDQDQKVLNYNNQFVEMWKIPQRILLDRDERKILAFMKNEIGEQNTFWETVENAYQQPEAESLDVLKLRDHRIIERYSKPQKIGGKTVGRVWSFRDVTQRLRSEAEQRASEEKYRAIFEESKDAIFISTPEGKFLDINPAGVELFGYASKEELLNSVDIGRDLYVDPNERQKTHQLLAEQGYIKDHLTNAKKKDGSSLMVLETTTAVRDETGKVIAYRGIIRDVTEQHRLEEQLRQVQRMESVGTLAGGIAHDFNNILSIAIGYLARLERPSVDKETSTRTIESIRKALARGTGLVQQLLTFARKTSGVPEAVQINDIVNELSTMLSETFPSSIRFDVKLDKRIPLLLADPGQIQQAILNLCINARDAMTVQRSDGRVGGTLKVLTGTVSGAELHARFPAASADSYILVRVSDTGVGMDDATKVRIFEPFFTTKAPGKGTGLGLAVVYGVVEGHKGFVDVESSPDKGATLSLYFPVQPVEAAVDADQQLDQPARGEGQTVLLVEDEEMLLDLLQALLEENGYRVLTARDGMEAVDVYKSNSEEISIVLSDMGLPKLGGWEAFRRMREVNPDMRCILASGYFDPELRMEMIREGALDFVQKPYVPNIILSRISDAIKDRPVRRTKS